MAREGSSIVLAHVLRAGLHAEALRAQALGDPPETCSVHAPKPKPGGQNSTKQAVSLFMNNDEAAKSSFNHERRATRDRWWGVFIGERHPASEPSNTPQCSLPKSSSTKQVGKSRHPPCLGNRCLPSTPSASRDSHF